MTHKVVIAGAGHAAGQAVITLMHHDFAGRITLVGEEPQLPYQRPPLSKKYLAGELAAQRLYLKPPSFFDDPRIEVISGAHVDQVDREAGRLETADGARIAYDTLILATGSRVRRLDVEGAALDGIFYLRTIGDVDSIRAGLAPGKRIVIVGAGYIGLEVAAVCRQRGLDVTVLEMADRVMSRSPCRVGSPHRARRR